MAHQSFNSITFAILSFSVLLLLGCGVSVHESRSHEVSHDHQVNQGALLQEVAEAQGELSGVSAELSKLVQSGAEVDQDVLEEILERLEQAEAQLDKTLKRVEELEAHDH